jgi:ABC-type nickel/cobalt efflux system permease component RcnA
VRARSWLFGIGIASQLVAAVLLTPRLSLAHPMGNFSISHYAGIKLAATEIELRYLIDMAEIPTFQELQDSGLTPEADPSILEGYLARKAESLKDNLYLEVNGERLVLVTSARDLLFSPGAGGLPTMKLGILYRASLTTATAPAWHRVRYRDENFLGRAGWKEVMGVPGPGVVLASSSVPEQDRSQQLADYPTDMLNSPPQILEAQLVFGVEQPTARASLLSPKPPSNRAPSSGMGDERASPGAPKGSNSVLGRPPPTSPEPALQPNKQATRRDAFSDLIAVKQTGVGVFLFAALVAATLGAFHALEPGHGKTVVAAYLVGSRGTAWHAVLLGLIVTASHPAGVYLLGGVTLYASRYVVPERLYPWLGVLSGLTIAGLGCFLFLRRYAESAHGHRHDHEHMHTHPAASATGHAESHHELEHGHGGHHHHHHVATRSGVVSLRELFALGITGGIVPCPAALVVLLSAIALRRVGFGLFLIVAFSMGLAVVLIAIGMLMVYAGRMMARVKADGPWITRWLPLTSSAVMTLLGMAIAVQALLGAGIVQVRLG